MHLSSVPKVLRDKIIPYAADEPEKRIIIARSTMNAQELPAGVKLERRREMGRRAVVKSRRLYANARSVLAAWPELRLHETVNLKMVCVTGGQAAYPVGDSLLHMGEGFFIFIPPGVPHPDGTTPHLKENRGYCELFHLMLHPSAVQCWTCLSENDAHGGSQHENYLVREEKTAQLFRALAEEAIANEESDAEIVQNLMLAFFRVLLRDLQSRRYVLAGPSLTHEKPGSSSGEFSAELLNYISAHLHEPITIESAAAHLFLSRAQFARRVKRETGKTFGELLTEHRLENARTLLRESEWTASVIAGLVGFKSEAYFNHFFVRHTGHTPGRYRQAARRKKNETMRQFVRR